MKNISAATYRFLKDLRSNNNREWFLDNKSRYELAKQEFELFVDEVIRKIAKFDASIAHHKAKDCVFRIYRDVRFSKDKSPYKSHFGAHITAAAKKSEIHTRAGYYLHLEPGASMLAGGAYMPEGQWLKAIRQEIAFNGKEFKKIIGSASFKKYFGAIEGEKLKNPPREYAADHPDIELLKHKSFLASHNFGDKTAQAGDFAAYCGSVFKALYPFDNFLNRASD